MIPQVVTVGPLVASSATKIALSQSPGAAGDLTINGAAATAGVATLDVGRRVLITSGGNDSALTFTVYGTNQTGNPIQETLAGGNATGVATLQDYKTVTRVAISAAAASTVTVGTNGVASSAWQAVNYHFGPASFAFNAVISGTINFTIQGTLDNPNAVGIIPGVIPTPLKTDILAAGAASASVNSVGPITYWRVLVNSQTNPASVTVTAVQAGLQN